MTKNATKRARAWARKRAGLRKLSDACPSCDLPVWSNQPHSGKPVHHDGACGLAVALGKSLASSILSRKEGVGT